MANATNHNQRTSQTDSRPDMIDRLIQESSTSSPPCVSATSISDKLPSNLVETWESYWVQVALPGVDLRTLQVRITGRTLTVEGRYRVPAIEAGTVLSQGIPGAEFHHSCTLPGEVDGDGTEANFERGILTIRMPKVRYLKPKLIKVHSFE